MNPGDLRLGLRANWEQFSLLVVVNAFVGGMVGLERTVIPLIAEAEFGLASRSAVLSFLVTFGLVKALANLFAGRMSDRLGRKQILVAGWLAGLPVPFLIIFAPSWGWVVFANVLLGLNQGLCWSTTVIMKIDLVGPKQRGLAMGLNEFAGYLAVSFSALMTGYLAAVYGLRPAPFYPGIVLAVAGLVLSFFFVRETRGHARLEAGSTLEEDHERSGIPSQRSLRMTSPRHVAARRFQHRWKDEAGSLFTQKLRLLRKNAKRSGARSQRHLGRVLPKRLTSPRHVAARQWRRRRHNCKRSVAVSFSTQKGTPSFAQILLLASWKDRALFAASQAGMVNNLNDGMVWGLVPIFLAGAGLPLEQVGLVAAVYPGVWGISQLLTGALSDRWGRKGMIVSGMFVQAAGIGLFIAGRSFLPWLGASALLGIGTAMVYPTLIAAVSDVAHPDWRASAVGVYRLWRDGGYAAGALVSGLLADAGDAAGIPGIPFAMSAVAALTFLSGVIVALVMYETMPARRRPAFDREPCVLGINSPGKRKGRSREVLHLDGKKDPK